MKTKQLWGAALALIVLGHSCKNDDYRDAVPQNENSQVNFSATIAGNIGTRVTGNTWDGNDAIGVFMKQASNVLASNKKYTTGGNGNFSAQGQDLINYPESGAVDFIAYYPYNTELTGTSLPVSVADQSNQAAIDVLYSNNAKGLTKETGTAQLQFAHQLAKVELSVKAGQGVENVNGLSVSYNNVPTTANLDLNTGALNSIGTPANVSAKVTAQNSAQVVEAILIPGDFSAKEVIFTVASVNYKWTLPNGTNFEAGKKYTYDIQLQTEAGNNTAVVTGAGTITDWINVPSGSVNVGLDGENGGSNPGTNPGTGEEQTLYSETFGEEPAKGGRMESFNQFTATGVTYADLDPASYVDIRSTSTMSNHVWFPATKTTGFKIDGINATGFTNLVLTYDLACNKAGAPFSPVKVKVNGVSMTIPEGSLDASKSNVYSTITLPNITAANTLTIEFEADAADNITGMGYRVDNIKVTGTK